VQVFVTEALAKLTGPELRMQVEVYSQATGGKVRF
jgi:hypothetical protein